MNMKRFFVLIALIGVAYCPSYSMGIEPTEPEKSEKSARLEDRLNELDQLDLSTLSRKERREVRREKRLLQEECNCCQPKGTRILGNITAGLSHVLVIAHLN